MDAGVKYRPDIDGLRAIAVLAVIAFHAFPTWVPGGFVGVDVFFVISGYLISQQLFAASDLGTFSIVDFYVRRIRRIVPALSVVLLATLAVGWFAMTPREFAGLQRHVAASAVFSNNFLLWYESGYFDAPSRAKPLLHLWSLGVEEQFYLFWPWLVLWCWRHRLNRRVIVGTVVVTSLVASCALMANGNDVAAFYLPHSRLWQIAAGAWLAAATMEHGDAFGRRTAKWLFVDPTRRDLEATQNLFAIIGLTMIAIAIIALGQAGQPSWWTEGSVVWVMRSVRYAQRALGVTAQAPSYPGWPALLPTAGAALIIAAGPSAWINRGLLSARIPVFIGLISYPFYLWHWPLLSFLSLSERGHVPRRLTLAALALAFILASAVYFFIERPIRSRIDTTRRRRASALVLGLAGMGMVMLIAIGTHSWLPPLRVAVAADEIVPTGRNGGACRSLMQTSAGFCQEYLDSGPPVTTVLFGDSHASHLMPGLGDALARRNENLVQVGDTDCPPLVNVERGFERGHPTCAEVNTEAIQRINSIDAITDVVLAFRYHRYTSGAVPSATATPIRMVGTAVTGEAALESALPITIQMFIEHHKRVTIALPTPELGFPIGECLGRPWSLTTVSRREPCAVAKADVLRETLAYRQFVAGLARRLPILVVDPLAFLCDAKLCWAIKDGEPFYMDDNHLGVSGSLKVARMFRLQG